MKITRRYPVGKASEAPVKMEVTPAPAQPPEPLHNGFHAAMLLALGLPDNEVKKQIMNRPLPHFSLNN